MFIQIGILMHGLGSGGETGDLIITADIIMAITTADIIMAAAIMAAEVGMVVAAGMVGGMVDVNVVAAIWVLTGSSSRLRQRKVTNG